MLDGSYSYGLVIMSLIVAMLAAYTAIDMARRIVSASTRTSRWWLLGGAAAMGTGIWSMHFLGMLALRLPIPMGYDPGITCLSWLIGVAASAFALWLTTRDRWSPPWLMLGAITLGGGIAGMHYTGMAAMRMQPGIVYQPWLLGLSIVFAVVVSGIGLHIIHRLRRAGPRTQPLLLMSAIVIGLSISGMHYIGMAAAHFPTNSLSAAAPAGLHADWLTTLMITLGSLCALVMALMMSGLEQRVQLQTMALTSSLEQANQELDHLASHDPLTKLPNRNLLEEQLTHSADMQAHFALLYIDLDGFKVFNDAFGHRIGDLVLTEVAQRLTAIHHDPDMVSRQGGDEFAALIHIHSRADAETAAKQVLALFHEPIVVFDQTLRLSASVGVALYPEDGCDAPMLLSHADAAMSQAKDKGRNGYAFFDPSMTVEAQNLLLLSQALGPAMARNEFYLVYQPKYDAIDESMVGVEALVRWNHPQQGVIGPDVFIPLAERTGMINELGVWILDEACRQLAVWHQRDIMIQMSVNLSVQQFCSFGLIEDLRNCLTRYVLKPDYLILEITESIAMQDVEHSLRMLQQMRELGVRISIDDFGTGYSSLAYLKRLLAHELKIDRSFVQNLQDGKEDAAIVSSIIALGKTLGMTVTAEGVETGEQKDFLRRQHCTLLQGFLLGRPVPPEQLHLPDYRHKHHPSAAADRNPATPKSTSNSPYMPATFDTLDTKADDAFQAANAAAIR